MRPRLPRPALQLSLLPLTVLLAIGLLQLPCCLLAESEERREDELGEESGVDSASRSNGATIEAISWPQFRGPAGDGKSTHVEFPDGWPESGPEKLWSVPLGGGFSGISAVDGTLYTLFSDGDSEFIGAFHADNGKERWRHRADDVRRDQFGDGPRSTPTLEGDRLWAVSSLGHLWCLDRSTGKPIWDRDLREEYGAVVPTWGVSATPVIFEGLLLFNVGGKPGHALMAFDKTTGEVRWASESGIPGYSLPLTLEAAGRVQTLFFTGNKILSVDPENGELLWQKAWKTAYDVNAAAPVHVGDGKIFVSSGYDTGASLFQIVEKDGSLDTELLWRTSRMKNQFSSSIYHQGHIYGFDNKTLKCIDAENGQDMWRKSGFGHGSLFYGDGKLVVLGDNGKLALVSANPEAFEQKAITQVATGKHWTVPTYYAGRLFVRNERELIAFAFDS